MDLRAALQLIYEECPILAELPLVTEGFICVGTSVHTDTKFMEERLVTMKLNQLTNDYYDFCMRPTIASNAESLQDISFNLPAVTAERNILLGYNFALCQLMVV